ncbi:FTR1 family protein [Conexibacter sp. DBS9H8]|uniref:FTR1 family iron permease n=1 Tax=Conexibacter sp. DBS9H8 TaxID=2937801 RepID=UPI00200EDA60|nr:FTR1 family protein [Conexibacter sp. DBS9H8]
MTPTTTTGTPQRASSDGRTGTRWSFYVWIALALAVASAAVILGWHSSGGTVDPSVKANALHMSRTTAVINSAILVFREGLETILVLAAITASFRGSNSEYRRPVAGGAGLGLLATVGTWFAAVGLLGIFGHEGLTLQAATGIPAIIVLLLVMNWFFHKVYWTGWISHHNKRRRSIMSSDPAVNRRRALLGFVLLGFTSIYREGFEVVLFLQNLRLTFGSSVVLEGVTLGALFTAAVGVLTFTLHAKLPYKKLLIITGVMLLVVLLVMVGEEVNEMQLAGWISTTPIGVSLPGWLGQWLSIFPNWETVIAQFIAVAIVVGSYVGAQYVKVWRPRRRGLAAAKVADEPPAVALPQAPLSV